MGGLTDVKRNLSTLDSGPSISSRPWTKTMIMTVDI